jgi:hypothetical protein
MNCQRIKRRLWLSDRRYFVVDQAALSQYWATPPDVPKHQDDYIAVLAAWNGTILFYRYDCYTLVYIWTRPADWFLARVRIVPPSWFTQRSLDQPNSLQETKSDACKNLNKRQTQDMGRAHGSGPPGAEVEQEGWACPFGLSAIPKLRGM